MYTTINPIIFQLEPHPLFEILCKKLNGRKGAYEARNFPDGESYLKINTDVSGAHCCVLVNLSNPNIKYLPLIFMLATLRELGAKSVGLIAPYLSYMRQDRRFIEGEAVTSRIFAKEISSHIDWLVTVDPHLHRYHSLDEIYSVPSVVVQGAPAVAEWLKNQKDVFLVGPDSESEQWVSEISKISGHSFVIGQKKRFGDRHVEVSLDNLDVYKNKTAVIIDDVISSGQTILKCIQALKDQNISSIKCAAVHGIFADQADKILLSSGLDTLITCNTISHSSNAIDVSDFLVAPIYSCITKLMEK